MAAEDPSRDLKKGAGCLLTVQLTATEMHEGQGEVLGWFGRKEREVVDYLLSRTACGFAEWEAVMLASFHLPPSGGLGGWGRDEQVLPPPVKLQAFPLAFEAL